MHRHAALRAYCKDRGTRAALAVFGLCLCAVGSYFQIQADIGLSPWFALAQGLSFTLPISYGTASILVSVVVLAADLLLRESIGIGTILDVLVMGWVADLCLWLGLIPVQTRLLPQLALLLLGLLVQAVGIYVYMKAGLSCGPRDALMVAMGKRLSRVSIGTANTLLSLVVLAAGTLLGSRVGVGTVVSLFGIGAMMDLVFRLFRFEPRSVAHEGFVESLTALRAALRADRGCPAR